MREIKACACARRPGAAASMWLRLARLPPPASRMRRLRRLRDTLAAAPGLLAHDSVTETVKLCPMGPNSSTKRYMCIAGCKREDSTKRQQAPRGHSCAYPASVIKRCGTPRACQDSERLSDVIPCQLWHVQEAVHDVRPRQRFRISAFPLELHVNE
jgi:hypothetical protein